MRTLRDRARDAILGAFVGDAAATGLHWIYDVDEVERLGGDAPEFFSPKDNQYHAKRAAGRFTHYGDHALVVLESVAERGGFDADDYRRRMIEHFGGADYDGYLDHATKDLIATGTGADDNQAGAFAKLPVLVARYIQSHEDPVEDAIRVTHDNVQAVRYGLAASDAIGAAILGASPREVAAAVADGPGAPAAVARKALDAGPDTTAFAKEAGQTCPVPGAFPVALHAALHAADFKDMVRRSIRSGGDTAGRLLVSGALWGAHEGVPGDWLARVEQHDRLTRLTQTVLDQAGLGN
jgi:ADP-ribosylglycohydrolase